MARSIVLLDMDSTLTDTQEASLDAVTKVASQDFGAQEREFQSSLVEVLRGHSEELWDGI